MSLRDEFLKELQSIVGQSNQRLAVADGSRTIPSPLEEAMAVVTPMTFPSSPSSGPPELPGLIAASVWMKSS